MGVYMSHYYQYDPTLKSELKTYQTTVRGVSFSFLSDRGVFSQDHLDYGSKVLIESIEVLSPGVKVLDMGSGIGVVGIILKKLFKEIKLTQADVNLRAIELNKENLKLNQVEGEVIESNLFEKINGSFDLIISNPPIRTGKEVIYKLYMDAYHRLLDDGVLAIVVRKQQGAKSTITYLEAFFKSVKVVTKSKGFYVIHAYK